MGLTNFPNGISSFGVPQVGGSVPTVSGSYLFVDGTNGADGNSGKSLTRALATVQRAVNIASAGAAILIASGEYDEAVTISRTAAHTNLTLVGLGGRGSVFIAPSTAAAVAVTNHADDLTIINVGLDGNTTGAGMINTGTRLRIFGSKIEGDDIGIQLTLGTVAQEAAGTHGRGADCLLHDCELAWSTKGLLLTCTDFGGVTQIVVRNSRFYAHSASSIDESVGSGGAAAVTFFSLLVKDCSFDDAEDGTAPTKFISLNANNANAGVVTGCRFPSAINSGKNLVSTAVHWVSNFHTGGVSTAQPS